MTIETSKLNSKKKKKLEKKPNSLTNPYYLRIKRKEKEYFKNLTGIRQNYKFIKLGGATRIFVAQSRSILNPLVGLLT